MIWLIGGEDADVDAFLDAVEQDSDQLTGTTVAVTHPHATDGARPAHSMLEMRGAQVAHSSDASQRRLPARARRSPRRLGRRRPPVPRRPAVDAGRLPRRGGVLRHQRLPDHAAADRGARPQLDASRCATSGRAAPAGCSPRSTRCSPSSRSSCCSSTARRPPTWPPRCGRRCSTSPTGTSSSPTSRTSPSSNGRRSSSTSGRWRSRSSSTSSGRSRCLGLLKLFGNRRRAMALVIFGGAAALPDLDVHPVRAGNGSQPRLLRHGHQGLRAADGRRVGPAVAAVPVVDGRPDSSSSVGLDLHRAWVPWSCSHCASCGWRSSTDSCTTAASPSCRSPRSW